MKQKITILNEFIIYVAAQLESPYANERAAYNTRFVSFLSLYYL